MIHFITQAKMQGNCILQDLEKLVFIGISLSTFMVLLSPHYVTHIGMIGAISFLDSDSVDLYLQCDETLEIKS